MTSYITRLHDAVRRKGTPALVGLDPRLELLPGAVIDAVDARDASERAAAAFEEFCCRIIDVVAPLVPAVKPQAAFFEEHGPAGMQALARVIRRARDAGLIVVADGKRGDIGSTAAAYARGWLAGEDPDAAPWAADALTVNPLLGPDTLEPFVEVARMRGAGVYVLVRTSNPGAAEYQEGSGGEPLYRTIAATVEELASRDAAGGRFGSIGAVVGATARRQLAELRQAMPHTPFLVPGYGAQGAGADDVAAAFAEDGLGALVNSSRAVNFAYRRPPFDEQFGESRWEEAVEAATREMIAELDGIQDRSG